MKTKYFVIIALSVFTFFCNAESKSNSDNNTTDNIVNHQQSKLLIDRYNKVRQLKKMNDIVQDTTLDNICRTLITNKSYRNIDNTFKEDSVRYLLYKSGVLEYQYEIIETTDKDTASTFKSFFLVDNSSINRVGYVKNVNKHIIIRTISCGLSLNVMSARIRQAAFGGFEDISSAPLITDSLTFKFITNRPGKYTYQLCDHIPNKSEDLSSLTKYEETTKKSNIKQDLYDLELSLTKPKYFLVISFNGKIIALK